MRRLLALATVLGLMPGASPGLVSFGEAHCSHACCRGQDFCERGAGHEAHSSHDGEAHHASHAPGVELAISALGPPSETCRETCGVLREAQSRTVGTAPEKPLGTAPAIRSLALPEGFADRSNQRTTPASPRAPPPADL